MGKWVANYSLGIVATKALIGLPKLAAYYELLPSNKILSGF